MIRRSARIKSSNSPQDAEPYVESEPRDGDSDKETAKKPPRKKQKSKAPLKQGREMDTDVAPVKKFRGKRGALQQLTEMPLDILFEIFGQLEPLDLVHLSRTTKALRKVLLDNSALYIWKHVRTNMDGLPEPFENMSELEYATLMFVNECRGCLGRKSVEICWEIGARWCSNCILSNKEKFKEIERIYPNGRRERKSYSGYDYSFREVMPLVKVEISVSKGFRAKVEMLYLPIMEKNYGPYCELNEKEKSSWWGTAWARLETARKQASKCNKWVKDREQYRLSLLKDVRDRRIDEIITRLTDMGWGEVIKNLPAESRLQTHPLVSQKKELTERIWNNIKPTLVEFLVKEKDNYIARIELSKMEERLAPLLEFHSLYTKSKPINTIIPHPVEFYLFEPFRRLIMDTPSLVILSTQDFRDAQEGIDEFCAQWKLDKDHELLRMVLGGPISKQDLDRAETLLTLASTAFHCQRCYSDQNYVHYPRILMHEHTKYPYAFGVDIRFPLHLKPAFDKLAEITSSCQPMGVITFSSAYQEAAAVIISACGLDPDVASISEMEKLDPIFECVTCCRSSQRIFMSWRSAIQHLTSTYLHSKDEPIVCNIADKAMSKSIKSRRYEAFLKEEDETSESYNGHMFYKRFVCTICRFRDAASKMRSHFLEEHQKETVTPEDVVRYIDEKEDYFTYKFPVDCLGIFGDTSV